MTARVSVTLLLQPGAPEAAFSVRIFLPRTALPVLHFVAPDEVPVVGPADHIVGHVIDKILLRQLVPDRQALGAVRLFHVLSYQLFQLSRAKFGNVADAGFTAAAGNVLLVGDEGLASAASSIHGNV